MTATNDATRRVEAERPARPRHATEAMKPGGRHAR